MHTSVVPAISRYREPGRCRCATRVPAVTKGSPPAGARLRHAGELPERVVPDDRLVRPRVVTGALQVGDQFVEVLLAVAFQEVAEPGQRILLEEAPLDVQLDRVLHVAEAADEGLELGSGSVVREGGEAGEHQLADTGRSGHGEVERDARTRVAADHVRLLDPQVVEHAEGGAAVEAHLLGWCRRGLGRPVAGVVGGDRTVAALCQQRHDARPHDRAGRGLVEEQDGTACAVLAVVHLVRGGVGVAAAHAAILDRNGQARSARRRWLDRYGRRAELTALATASRSA